MLNEARKEEVLELAKVLISQQSYSGHEGGVAAELEKYMKANGFDDVTVDKYGNIIGKIKGNRPGKKVLFDGHIDTVPVANPAGGRQALWPWHLRYEGRSGFLYRRRQFLCKGYRPGLSRRDLCCRRCTRGVL